MPSIPTNIPASERKGSWETTAVDQGLTTTGQRASLIDILEEGQIGQANWPQNQALEAPRNKASDVRSTIGALGSLNAENLGSDSFSLLRLLHKCSLDQRTGARMVRQSEGLAAKNAKYSAAQEIRESAFQRMIGGVTASALQLGSAGIQAYSATQSLTSINSLKDATPTNVPDPTDTANAVSANNGISQDIAAQVEPGNALIEQPLSKSTGADTANAISADHNKALVVHGEQNQTMVVHGEQNQTLVTHNGQAGGQDPQITFQGQRDANKTMVADSGAPQRNVHIDEQGTLTVRDAKGNESLRIEIIDEATEVASVPAAANTPSSTDASSVTADADAEVAKPTDRELALKELDFRAARLKAASDMTQATGNVLNAVAQNSAASHDAQKTELEATATTHDMAVHQANDETQQTLEQARGWREMLQGIDQNNTETNRGISRNI